jgi:Ca2+/Na+ antiporter
MRRRKMMVKCHRWPPAVECSIRVYRKKNTRNDNHHDRTSLSTLALIIDHTHDSIMRIDLAIFLFKVSIVNNHLNIYIHMKVYCHWQTGVVKCTYKINQSFSTTINIHWSAHFADGSLMIQSVN